ncbi:HNH endonuclease signature motif containing protein [Gilliamella apicola]|uniref:HNH endonuclease signature motif containing protein n=1 Tax=Gilliamella sp. wkB178 TaxID=3120259 RepID=UPI0009BDBCE5
MPLQPLRRCSYPNCRNRVKSGRCDEHRIDRQHDKARGTAAQRGYNHRWRIYRIEYLRHNPLCKMCKDKGLLVPATVIDHITPVENGQSDPLFWLADNHQPLCRDCHSYKTRVIDKRGFGS